MKGALLIVIVYMVFLGALMATPPETTVNLKTKTGTIEGTLLVPKGKATMPVALIIAGSGPTDRDGNNPRMKNNSLKMLAHELSKSEIASLRYDKRGIARSRKAGAKEEDLRFDHYIEDAIGWITYLKKDERFQDIIVIGHSEGSLLGMVASKKAKADKFVSIAGPGVSADRTLKEQLKAQPAMVSMMTTPIIDKLVRGERVKIVLPMLHSLFRPSVQPYLISWFKYDPRKEIAKLKIPVLIIQGLTDIQVSGKDARRLHEAKPGSKMKIIDGMNHIFKEAVVERSKNIATYNQPELPIKKELVAIITDFINNP